MTGSSPFFSIDGAVAIPDLVDEGVPAHYGNPIGEQRALEEARAIVDLSHRAVVTISGEDRLSWLHSLTSAELATLQPGVSRETLLLDHQGRLEHAVKLIDDGTTVWMLVEPTAAADLVAWLDRMRFMLRVEVADRTADYAVIGFTGDSPGDVPTVTINGIPLVWRDPWNSVLPGGHQYAGGEHQGEGWTWAEAIVDRGALAAIAAGRSPSHVAGSLAAEALRIAAWRPRFATEVDEKTIPHELDWLRTAVHLSKGCYRGQETVAKVHNLGHPPRRLVFLHLDGSDSVLPSHGATVSVERDGELKPVGQVTSAALHHELGPVALAVIKRNVDPAAVLTVDEHGSVVTASQQVIVPSDAGAVADLPRLPRLGAVRRPGA
ncbi:CAF17-like 4Fe-4S cluster assembly/insertion protein YgfZ [Okibacterium endophyticum]